MQPELISIPSEVLDEIEQMFQKAKTQEPRRVFMAKRAAEWGADRELRAVCDALEQIGQGGLAQEIFNLRRPATPSLKTEARFAAICLQSPNQELTPEQIRHYWDCIGKAIESLPAES